MRSIDIHLDVNKVLTVRGEYRVSYPDIKGEGVGRFSRQEMLVTQADPLEDVKSIRFPLPGKSELSKYKVTNKTWNNFTGLSVYYLSPEDDNGE